MDRQIVYAGSIPLDTDLLNIQRNVQASIGALARAVLGDAGVVDGLACVPGGDAYSVVVGPGSYTVGLAADGSSFGSLAADATPLVQTAQRAGNTVLQLGPPADAGHVLCWLVQACVVQADEGPVALPYWNAANPRVPFSGPGNSGAAQNTRRVLRVGLSVKASGPQTVGAAVPPVADAGWVGLHVVTTYAGQPGVVAANIVPCAGAPRLLYTLPVLPPGRVNQEVHSFNREWRAPAGVRRVRVRLVGAGGGGGGGDSGFSGGGGGAGGYAEALLQVEPGQVYPITVGAGGGGNVTGSSGLAGGETRFAGLVRATGGEGGGSSNPDSHGGAPGRGVTGGLLQIGGFGGDGAVIAHVPAGTGGASAFGGGGRGADQGGLPAYGQAHGSGGGGGYGAGASGGAGAGGLVVLEY